MAAPPKKNPRKGCRPVRRQTKIHCPTWVPESAGSRRDGKIGNEFGISLAPLIARAVEIQASAQKAAFEEEEAERLRNLIKKLFGDIRRLCSGGAPEVAEEALPNRGRRSGRIFLHKPVAVKSPTGATFHSHSIQVRKISTKPVRDDAQPVRTTPAQAALLASEPLREMIELYWNALDNPGALSPQTTQRAAKE